jgi:hypothetical protein
VHRHEVALTDELIEFDVVHVAAGARLRGMQHQKEMVVVEMNLGHRIAICRVPDRERMEAERRRQHPLGRLGPDRYVYPHQSVGSVQQAG